MVYSIRIFDSVSELDVNDWHRVQSACGGSIFIDPRFMAAVENGMRQGHRFWYLIFYDDKGLPVACTSLCATTIDLANLADRRLAFAIRHVPVLSSRLRRLRALICGLPLMTGHNTLALTAPSVSEQILLMLDRSMRELASSTKIDLIVYKEFMERDLEWIIPLLSLGYKQISLPPMQFFRPLFHDFAHYVAALRSHYRKQINRSIRKLKQAGVEISILTDPKQICAVYTPEVHNLYIQMLQKADLKFEALTIDFFREWTLQLGDQVNLIVLAKDSKIIAIGWCLHARAVYYMLFAGLDYELNAELDLYFNLVYASLDCALKKRVSSIELGMTANAFKAKLGCYPESLYVFVKGVSPLISLLVRYGASLLVSQMPTISCFDIFKKNGIQTPLNG